MSNIANVSLIKTISQSLFVMEMAFDCSRKINKIIIKASVTLLKQVYNLVPYAICLHTEIENKLYNYAK